MKGWPFKSLVDVAGFAALAVAIVAGVLHWPPWSPIACAMALSLITWGADRWSHVVAMARDLDEKWHELARMCWDHGLIFRALWLWLRGSLVWLIYGVHMAHNLSFAVGSYAFGWAWGWWWGLPG